MLIYTILSILIYQELGRAQKFRCVNTCKNAQEDKQYYLQPLEDDLEGYYIQADPDMPCSYEYTSQAKFEKKRELLTRKLEKKKLLINTFIIQKSVILHFCV